MAMCLTGNRNMSEIEPEVVLIMKQFLCGVPLKLFGFKIDGLRSKQTDWQQSILQLTVLNPIVKEFPLLHSYQKAFLKFFMKKLEDNGIAICEELYVEYTKILSENDGNQSQYGHKIYLIKGDFKVVLRENAAIVSQGSTGLVTWQAAKFLADWCIRNKELFHEKCVLDLGCGLGLTGFCVAGLCQPRSYFFSDSHSEVIGQLMYNIGLNVSQQDGGCSSAASSGDQETDFLIASIDWSIENSWKLAGNMFPDIILAADVIYDVELIPHFVRCLSYFLHGSYPPDRGLYRKIVAYVACTVRNEETIQQFLNVIEAKGLLCEEVFHQKGNLFFYDPLYRVKLYKITVKTKDVFVVTSALAD